MSDAWVRRWRRVPWALLCFVLGGAGAVAATEGARAGAADHLDPPHRTRTDFVRGTETLDRASDIADVFAWTTSGGADLVLAMSFDGADDGADGMTPRDLDALDCDRDVLYEIHLDTDIDRAAGTGADDEFTIEVRLAPDSVGNCYARFSGIPGAAGDIDVAEDQALTRGGVSVYVGVRDDAFFFDLQGFRETLVTGALSLRSDRDFFAGRNTPALVVQFPLAAVRPRGDEIVRLWGSTARHP